MAESNGIIEYYIEGDRVVFTREYHLARGFCCGSGCRHCPYQPRSIRGNREIGRLVENQDRSAADSDQRLLPDGEQ